MIRNRAKSAYAAVLIAGLALVLPACGDPKDASLCTAFGELVDARAAVRAIDPTLETAGRATGVAQDYLAGVHRLQHAADGRYGTELDALEMSVNDLLLTLSAIPDDAEYATWGPLVADDLESAADAATVVENAIEPSCTPDTSGD